MTPQTAPRRLVDEIGYVGVNDLIDRAAAAVASLELGGGPILPRDRLIATRIVELVLATPFGTVDPTPDYSTLVADVLEHFIGTRDVPTGDVLKAHQRAVQKGYAEAYDAYRLGLQEGAEHMARLIRGEQ